MLLIGDGAAQLTVQELATVLTVEQVMKRRPGALAGRISPDEQRDVDNALRAALEL